MAADVPSRTDHEANQRAMKAVMADKAREIALGFSGTWVAHPDLVRPVRELFDAQLQGRDHQKPQITVGLPADETEMAANLRAALDFQAIYRDAALQGRAAPRVTLEGVRSNVGAALLYIAYWISGTGAVALHNKMEDAATAEISRAQLWQWLKFGVDVHAMGAADSAMVPAAEQSDCPASQKMTRELYLQIRTEELRAARVDPQHSKLGEDTLAEAAALLDGFVLDHSQFAEFITLGESYHALRVRDQTNEVLIRCRRQQAEGPSSGMSGMGGKPPSPKL